jgi:glycosyltransferase involved in cell wall biosynthesis/ubiquinone/menaquinone biosynthesis C-methylase UbiE
MEFTGERFLSNISQFEISYEHWHRYLYASNFVKNRVVLDIACGEGYGSYLLSKQAKSVVGVDIDSMTIEYAKNNYITSNLSFITGSASKIPISDHHCFDIIVSFETIEHLSEEDQFEFLSEIKRLLKKDGIFIVSTPNKLIYSDIPKYQNEFHLKEFYFSEFETFLNKSFKFTCLFGQQIYTASYISDPIKKSNKILEFNLENTDKGFIPSNKQREDEYIVAICSDAKFVRPQTSISFDPNLDLSKHEILIQTLFLDVGNGYREKDKINKSIDRRDKAQIQIEYDLSGINQIKNLRLDPCEDYCKVGVKRISLFLEDNTSVELGYWTNANSNADGVFNFDTNDPQFYLQCDDFSKAKKLVVDIEYISIGLEYLKFSVKEKWREIESRDEVITNLENQNSSSQKDLSEGRSKLDERTKLISQQEALITQQKDFLLQKQALILKLEKVIEDNDHLLLQKDSKLQDNLESLQSRQNAINEYKVELNKKEGLIGQHLLTIDHQKNIIQLKKNQELFAENQIREKDVLISKLELDIEQNKGQLLRKQDFIFQNEDQIKKDYKRIVELQDLNENNQQLLEEKQELINQKEEVLEDLKLRIETISTLLKEKEEWDEKQSKTIKIHNQHINNLEQEINDKSVYIYELKHSISFRLGWGFTAPARLIYNLFEKRTMVHGRFWLWWKFFANGIQKPLKTLKEINVANLRTLIYALKHENPETIFYNFKKLINKSPKVSTVTKYSKPTQLVINNHKQENETAKQDSHLISLLNSSDLFDKDYYLATNPDVKESGIEPVEHYLFQGWKEGRNPSSGFDTNYYLSNNKDVEDAQLNPLVHYLEHGRSESRSHSFNKKESIQEIQQKLKPFQELSTRPHSILFISHDAKLAGAEMLLLYLLKWFVEHTAYRVNIICIEGGVLLEQFQNLGSTIVWEEFITQNSNKSERQKGLIKFCGQIDLVYGSTVLSPSIYDELSFLDVPMITHVHELEKSIKNYVKASTLKNMHKYTTAYIGCSTPVTKNLEDNHFADKKQITTIYDFIDSYKELPTPVSKSNLRKKLQLNENSFIVFGCGTIYWRKGVDLFIDTALQLLKKGFINFVFYWIGPQYWDAGQVKGGYPTWAELEEKMKNEGLEKYITFLGEKTNLREYFSAGDLFYLPSREDPFPLVCLEAAACGMPTICFADAGGMPEFVKKDAGFVIPYEDTVSVAEKIEYLLDQPKLLQKLGECAKEKMLAHHTTDTAGLQVLRYFKKVGNPTPLVSVILPNYNYEKYLGKRLESIFNQTFKDYEVIILDDASSDNSLELINKYTHHSEVNLIVNKRNSGVVFKQWEKGIKQAKGEIIWIAEADDFCHPEFLERLLPKFKDKEVAIAYANSHIVDEEGLITGDYTSYYESTDVNHWKTSYVVAAEEEINYGLGVKNTIPNVSAVLFRKDDLIEKIVPSELDYILSGDWFTYIQVIKNHKIAFCVEKLNFHRKHKHTVTKQTHQENKKQIILDEAARIHEMVISDYNIDSEYAKKWDKYISEQIAALYFPTPRKKEYDKLYPYANHKLRIEKKAVKLERKINKTAIIVTHVANKTGAPFTILNMARHLFEIDNIRCITFALEGGELLNEFKKYGEAWIVSENIIQGKNISVSKYILKAKEAPSFALIQTACCGDILPELAKCNTKIVTFIHDYTYAFGKPYLKNMYNLTDQIVYSVSFMQNKNIQDFPFDLNKTAIIPQGLYNKDILTCDVKILRKELRTKLNIPDDAFVVLGIGFIHPRKGIDVFIDTAIQTISLAANMDVHFVWLGDELKSDSPDMYIRFLARDIINSNNEDKIHFVRQEAELAAYYSIADLFFLSSREDPFPTVVLEAFAAGVPVIGIEGSSGSIEIIKKCENFTVPYQERAEIPNLIIKLMNNKNLLQLASQNGKAMMLADFNFDDYIISVKRLLVEKLDIDPRIFNML